MIGDYFTEALQGSQFRCFRNIILSIHEDYIPSYNTPGREFMKERRVKLERDKESYNNDAKLAGE